MRKVGTGVRTMTSFSNCIVFAGSTLEPKCKSEGFTQPPEVPLLFDTLAHLSSLFAIEVGLVLWLCNLQCDLAQELRRHADCQRFWRVYEESKQFVSS